MIVSRFGSTWAGAYMLPNAMMVDDFGTDRQALSARVGGLDGEFDYHGDDANPIGPVTVKKTAIITATSWAGVETALDALRAATITQAESKLWLLMRDGSHRWAWAKCIGLSDPDRTGQFLHCPIEITFYLSEGLWYSESENTATLANAGSVNVVNVGNVAAAVRVGVTVTTAALTAFAVSSAACGWSFAGSVAAAAGEKLIVDAAAYSALNNGSDCYANLTITNEARLYLFAEPGTTLFTITKTQGGGGTISTTLKWYDTWVL